MRSGRTGFHIVAVGLAAACVAYDSAGPPVPSIAGTYVTIIALRYSNYIELRADTLAVSVTLHDTHYRGRFDGMYQTAFGDSGRFAGAERPESTLVVDVFGAPPKPIANVVGLRRVYPWCDFLRLGTGSLSGRLRGDSLLVEGGGSLPCFYHVDGTSTEVPTELRLEIRGSRGR